MDESEKNEIKEALAKVVTRLLLLALVVLGAVDYAVIAPYMAGLVAQAQQPGGPAYAAFECR